MFSFGKSSEPESSSGSNLGRATKDTAGNSWDSMFKASDIPKNEPMKLSDSELKRKKKVMLSTLHEMHDKGWIQLDSRINIDSPFEDIEDEYETAMEEKRRRDSIKLQQWWFTTFANSIEYANSYFDPFGLNLEGLGENINEDISSYDEIFGELHDKYRGAKLSPELNLLLRLGFTVSMVSITNRALAGAPPEAADIIRSSPELMKAFTARCRLCRCYWQAT
jgi:hypothetical protein